MFLRLFGEGEISEESKFARLQIAGATKTAISLNWKERYIR
jgi:hypothetical protein